VSKKSVLALVFMIVLVLMCAGFGWFVLSGGQPAQQVVCTNGQQFDDGECSNPDFDED
jgi:hypothetical protein